MAETIIMRGAYAITDPRVREAGVISDGAVAITDGIVVETGVFAELAPKYPGAQVIGDGTQLLLPGLVDPTAMGAGYRRSRKACTTIFWRTLCSTGHICRSCHPS